VQGAEIDVVDLAVSEIAARSTAADSGCIEIEKR